MNLLGTVQPDGMKISLIYSATYIAPNVNELGLGGNDMPTFHVQFADLIKTVNHKPNGLSIFNLKVTLCNQIPLCHD